MNRTSQFSLNRFENRNGATSWRVSGCLAGERIRKNFKTREEAAAEKGVLELKAMQIEAGFRTVPTFLSDDQLREAESVFKRIEKTPRSLTALVDLALTHLQAVLSPRPLSECVPVYLESKHRDHLKGLLSFRQLRSIERELKRFLRTFPKAELADFSPRKLVEYMERGGNSLKTYNNRRGLLSTFFKFALQQDWLPTNPISKTPHHRIAHRRGSAVTINPEWSRELMAYVESLSDGAMVPYFALCLFAGIRPSICDGEITKLKPEHFNLELGVIHIEPEVSKISMKRRVTIMPNLDAWLRAYPLDEFPIIPKNAKNLRNKVAEHFKLTHDVLRHTFISMHVAKFRSLGEAALQAGNSESIIRKHYLDLKTPAEAEVFFGIRPTLRKPPATEEKGEQAA